MRKRVFECVETVLLDLLCFGLDLVCISLSKNDYIFNCVYYVFTQVIRRTSVNVNQLKGSSSQLRSMNKYLSQKRNQRNTAQNLPKR